MTKRIMSVCLTAAALAWAAPAAAQEHQGMMHRDLDEHIAFLDEQLDLTDAQESRIRPILADVVQRTEQMRASGDHATMHQRMGELHQQTVARVSEVLTATQRARLEELHAEMMQHHGGDHEAHSGHTDRHR